jgi:hypothetical protein
MPTTPISTKEKPSSRKPFYFQDPFTDFLFLFTLSKHAFEGAEIGECYSAAAQIKEGDVESWKEAWRTLAEKVEASATSAEAEGHRVSARQSYLRAVTYYRNVLWGFRVSDPGYRDTLEKSRVLFKRFATLSDPLSSSSRFRMRALSSRRTSCGPMPVWRSGRRSSSATTRARNSTTG